jgi:hypothetical protein
MNEPLTTEIDEPAVTNAGNRKTGLILTFAIILALLAVLALGQRRILLQKAKRLSS